MKNRFAKILIAASLLSVFALTAAGASAQPYRVETSGTAAPQELSGSVRATLGGKAFRVSGSQGVLCEIWLRNILPAKAAPARGLGIAYGQLSEGELLGAIRFASVVRDYRNQEIKPGVYTLRYALQPVDGNHQGVSPYRDFLLLVPAALDASAAAIATKDLYDLSRKASGTGHPSIWSLVAADTAPPTLPGLEHQDEGDLWVLYFRALIQPEGEAPSVALMGLVVAGHAAEA